jgi:hypothetical protein
MTSTPPVLVYSWEEALQCHHGSFVALALNTTAVVVVAAVVVAAAAVVVVVVVVVVVAQGYKTTA